VYYAAAGFSLPKDKRVIWRYMDLSKFVCLLETNCLYFSTVHQLEDPYEAYQPPTQPITLSAQLTGVFHNIKQMSSAQYRRDSTPVIDKILSRFRELAEDVTLIARINGLLGKNNLPEQRDFRSLAEYCATHLYDYLSKMEPTDINLLGALFQDIMQLGVRAWRNTFYVSCWHMNKDESAAMWKLYLSGGDGIAIRSTVGRFKKSISEAPEKVTIGKVKYKTISPGQVTNQNEESVLDKRTSFAHEDELRAVHMDRREEEFNKKVPTEVIDYFLKKKFGLMLEALRKVDMSPRTGKPIKVDVRHVIEHIFVPPTANACVLEAVKSINMRYNLNAEVTQSELYTLK
jgi:hypothetical protein